MTNPTDPNAKDGPQNEIDSAMLESLTPDVFDPLLNQIFEVPIAENRNVPIKLVEVNRHQNLANIEGGFDHRPRDPFSLLFCGPTEPLLADATYNLLNEQLKGLQVFLVPVTVHNKRAYSEDDCLFYEAVFS